MDILSVFLIASSLPFVSLRWQGCPQSIPTVSYVSRCPADAEEWKTAAAKKDCRALGMNQSCSDDDSFVYHCVLSGDGTKLMEVCAPVWYMSGYCARFSISFKRIVNNPDLDCTAFDTPCPSRFPSDESFKYQMCYKDVRDTMVHDYMDKIGYGSNNTIGMPSVIYVEKEQANNPALIAFLAVFIIIALCLLILLIYGKRLKNMICPRDEDAKQKENLPDSILETDALMDERLNVNEVIKVPLTDKPPIDTGSKRNEDSKDLTEIVSLSKSIQERVSLKDVENIGDLREKLCTKLDYPIELLWIVHEETGTIYKDDYPINASTKATYTLMLGNKKRADISNGDGRKFKKSYRSQVKCRMDCTHMTDAETLLQLIRDTLPETEYSELKCPLCSEVWKEQQLIEKCKMSDDERLFFDRVLEVNRKTKKIMFEKTLRNERQFKLTL
uniref:Uncharacterized protein LOC111110939 n=1 Tax=Crassostrea virginica TaxID=6565 RepID=A0A8B8BKD9_CRAVI|nr:uncharacterized protein LOC111110939 [Crassostrea virginica]